MGEVLPATPPSAQPLEERLDSWKEIAAYLNRDVTTVQRWEKREGMPVHRHLHDRMGSVYAFRSELEAWASRRKLRAAEDDASASVALNPPFSPRSPATSKSSTGSRLVWILMAAALLIGGGLWLRRTEYFWRNPIANVRFQTVTDFGGVARDAAVSRDGHFIAFLSDRDGQMDVWVTQAVSGEFHNLTHGNTRGSAIHWYAPWGFRPMGRWSRFGFVGRTARAVAKSVSGPCQFWGASRGRTLKAWPNTTGRVTALGWHTIRRDPGTRYLCRVAA